MIEFVRGEGLYLYDAHGEQLTDFTSGGGHAPLGHSHPQIVQAVAQQAGALVYPPTGTTTNITRVLAERWQALLPFTAATVAFAGSSVAAVETALHTARSVTKRAGVIAFAGAYYGDSGQTRSLSSVTARHRAHSPLTSTSLIAPVPTDDTQTESALAALDHLLATQLAGDHVAALLVQPIHTHDTGAVLLPLFLRGLAERAARIGAALIVDETHTGYGRVGRWFALPADIRPDLLILPGAGIAAQAPFAVALNAGASEVNALSQRQTLTTLDIITAEALMDNAQHMGEILMAGLRELQIEYSHLGQLNGSGLLAAATIVTRDGQPDGAACALVMQACQKKGLLLLSGGSHDHVVRWQPPLTVTQPVLEAALSVFEEALQKPVSA